MNESRLVERRVTYTLEHEGQFFVVENVPARVDEETGEQFFAPSTVDRLHEVIQWAAETRSCDQDAGIPLQ